jgi:hypothetical protein
MVPEGHAEQVQLGELKRYALAYGLDHFDSNENGNENWKEADKWGFNLILSKDNKQESESEKLEYFKDEDLIYASTSRCPCGAGLAYPGHASKKQMKQWRPDSVFLLWDHWDCSDILTGRAIPSNLLGSKTHTDKLPFSFYEIKSENQPSANGRTTRPSK